MSVGLLAEEDAASRVAKELLRRVLSGEYPAGTRLPAELDLARAFGCGRSTIREAMQQLTVWGVVRSRRGSGATVLDFRRDGTLALLGPYLVGGHFEEEPVSLARELLRMRALLAREAVRLAATYASEEDLAEATAVLDAIPEEGAAARALSELEFFLALVRAGKIHPFVWMANSYYASLREIHEALAPLVGGPPKEFVPSMRKLLGLVARRSVAEADAHIERWLAQVDSALLGAFGELFLARTQTTPVPRHKTRPPRAATNKEKSA